MWVFIALIGHSFYNLFIFARMQRLASSLSKYKEMMGEEVFQLHVAIPTYATCPMSLYKTRQTQQGFLSWRATGSSFPAGVQKGLLYLLVLYKFPTLKFCIGNCTKWLLVINIQTG